MKIKILLTVFLGTSLCCNIGLCANTAPNSPAAEEIWKLESEYFSALYRADYEGVLKLVHRSFLGWPGELEAPLTNAGSSQYMRKLIAQPLDCSTSIRRMGLQTEKNTAITHYVLKARCSGMEPRYSRITHTWIQEDSLWKLLGGMSQSIQPTLEDAGLVDLSTVDPTILLDIRYATENNFTRKKVYPSARCYLADTVAAILKNVQLDLKMVGLSLKIYDCYRPFDVQKIFWNIMPDEKYVLQPVEHDGKPVKGSRHNRGMAVDLTLVDANANELEMPTPFDDFTEKAGRTCTGASTAACKNMKTLEHAMTKYGMTPYPTEWWHFDGPGWETHELLNVTIPATKTR